MKIIEFLTPDRRYFIQVPYFLKNYICNFPYYKKMCIMTYNIFIQLFLLIIYFFEIIAPPHARAAAPYP